MIEVVQAMVGTSYSSSMVVGVLEHYVLLHFVCDLKTTQMNVQFRLIRELRLYEFKLSHKLYSKIFSNLTNDIIW